jgi:hypothetical protein
MKKLYLSLLLVFTAIIGYGQDSHLQTIKNFLNKEQVARGLESKDFSDLNIIKAYPTQSMDLENVYAQQQINGIPVFNAIGSFAIRDNEVVYFSNNFESGLSQRVNSETPSITPIQAVSNAAAQLGLGVAEPKLLSSENKKQVFSAPKISRKPVSVQLVYQPVGEENIRLAWDFSIHTLDGKHLWSVRVDARTGKIINKNDLVLSCSFGNHEESEVSKLSASLLKKFGKAPVSMLGDGSQYEVYPLPVESPNHGNRSIVSEPADAVASPFGWHDTDGIVGAEHTITRGNNVWASEDRSGFFSPGNSPDGGTTLDFIYPIDLVQNPYAYTDAATVNLFYMGNVLHDIWYQYGFDEASGNFQEKNYSNLGFGDDQIIALSQFGADEEAGNNASFFPTPEGQNPLILMETWDRQGTSHLLTINGTNALMGTYPAYPARFGPDFPTTPLSGELALVEDDNSGTSTDSHDACDNITNGTSLSGKIAVIRRGGCNFDTKIAKVEDEGAIAAIVVNDDFSNIFAMGGDNMNISIPSIMISKTDGDPIINSLINGDAINATFENTGPYVKDSDLDNGIIAHEYGHGISTRLTGGSSTVDCLSNEEQMGEGWSDFFGLVLTIEAGDQTTDSRGYGTYATGQPANGNGIRPFPYSTDMSINPLTYSHVDNLYSARGSHGVGTAWATMLWDLTWALIDKYGFDPDLYNGTGGNNIAMQLVIDGLKLQPCEPGFVDGRNAILAADMAANGGANHCLIWCVFSRRGLGWSADQGQSTSAYDQTAAFDMPPASELTCASCPNLRTSGFEVDEASFHVYPNPANGIVNIASHKINGEVRIALFDMNGRKIIDKKVDLDNNAQIDVSGLNTGIYVMHIISDGKTQTEKLIVQ